MSAPFHNFPSPFNPLPGVPVTPEVRTSFNWAERIYYANGTLASATAKAIALHMTPPEVSGEDMEESERVKWSDYLHEVKFMEILREVLLDRRVTGNSVSTMTVGFDRMLVCRCGVSLPFDEMNNPNYRFKFTPTSSSETGWQFSMFCPRCKKINAVKPLDTMSTDVTRIRIHRYALPREIELVHDLVSGDTQYWWRIPPDITRPILAGSIYHLQRCPPRLLTAICRNQYYRFNDDAVIHLKEPTLAGVRNGGWGLPPYLPHAERITTVQVLRRAVDVAAREYVLPFRVISLDPRAIRPGASGQTLAGDPSHGMSGVDISRQLQRMVRRRQVDPSTIQISPFPIRYQLLGADISQVVPLEILQATEDGLLNDYGYPIELWKGSLTIQQAPMAGRLFQATFSDIPADMHRFASWFTKRSAQIMRWQEPTVKFQPSRIFDDPRIVDTKLSLYMAGKLPGAAIWPTFNRDWKADQKLLADEAMEQAKIQGKMQQDANEQGIALQLSQAAQPDPNAQGGQGGGQPQQGGQGGGQGGPGQPPVPANYAPAGAPISMNDVVAQAQELAQELLGEPNGAARRQKLQQMKAQNPDLHRLVRQYMDEQRQQVNQQGAAAARQQSGVF